MEVWNDFRYEQGTEAYHNIPFYNYAQWKDGGNLERLIKREYNAMDYVYRTALMAREPQPYVLIVDDIKKDASTHNYKWLMQVANDLVVDGTDVSNELCDYRNDLILGETNGNNRKFLVRVLEANGNAQVYHETVTPGINGNDPITRVVVETNAVEPEFKVLLFPYTDGDALPLTAWNTNKNELTVSLNGRTNQFLFDETNDHTAVTFEAEANVDECGNPLCASVDLDIFFDGFPSQTSWDITDANGSVVVSSGGTYSGQAGNSMLNLTPACLPDGCYDLTFYDALNNGMCPFQSSALGVSTFITPGTLITPGSIIGTLSLVVTPGLCGNYKLYDAQGNLIVSGGGGFGASETTNFCLVNGMGQRTATKTGGSINFSESEMLHNSWEIYPTLASDFINISYAGNLAKQVNLIDITGHVLQQFMIDGNVGQQLTIDLKEVPVGIHFIQMVTEDGVVVSKTFVKQ